MQGYLTLTRRELGAFFVSINGYVIIAAAAFLMFRRAADRCFVDVIPRIE